MKVKQNKSVKILLSSLTALMIVLVAIIGVYNFIIPDSVSFFSGSSLPEYPLTTASFTSSSSVASTKEGEAFDATTFTAQYKLFGVIPLKTVSAKSYDKLTLYPGGMPFGVKFFTEGVLVVGFCDIDSCGKEVNPAYSAGIRTKDVITKIDGKELGSANELTEIIEKSGGRAVTLTLKREGVERNISLTPAYSEAEGRYKTGMWIKDSGAGIGTVTFIMPETNAFAGLGHGICDSDTGELIPMQRGTVVDVTISGLVKGLVGTPGEVKGYFNSGKTGSLLGNTHCGVYGILLDCPSTVPEKALPIALKNEVKEGKAYIYSTLDTNKICKYEIEISSINKNANGNKCFSVKITDKALLEKTGGIIQGMSGSPIIQDGKLVGAVTHVLINDPTSGYGIFIENMLDNMPDLIK